MQTSKLATFKRLLGKAISKPPIIESQSSTRTWKYVLPTMPRIDTKTPIKLVLDPGLPRRLIDELHQFTDRLTEDRLDDLKLQRAELAVETALEISGDCSIESGSALLGAFAPIVMLPVQSLCRTLGIAASYRNGQRFLTLDPDFGWFVGGKQINVFEHKAPKDFDRHSSTLLRMASQGQTLKLGMKPEKGASLVSKAILTSIVEEVEYCVVLSMESFIIVRLVQNPTTGLRQARISTVIPLTSQATPIISLMVALILQSKPNTRAPADPDVSSQPTPSGSLETSVIGSWASTNQTDNEYPGLYSRGEHLSVFRTARAHEYWEPENVSEISLATMMKSTDGISVCWDMKPFSREIFRPIRRDDSTVWSSLPSEVVPRLKPSPESDRSTESLERPSRIPFVLRLTSTVGQGAVGTVYKGHFLGHPVPLIAKLLPLEQMDLELEIWKKLQHLAGTGVPGLFGAYALERQDEHEATGALIQQFVGKTLPNVYPQTFSPLTFDQRVELYRIMVQIHRAGVQHGDLRPVNVALDHHGRVNVIDFSHSQQHDCKGEAECTELKHLRSELILPDDFRGDSLMSGTTRQDF